MIKPRAVREHLARILDDILHNGITIRRMETRPLTPAEAEFLYYEHKGRDYYDQLIAYTLSGPVVLLQLEKLDSSDVVGYWRMLMGDTNSADAAGPTLRARYGNPKVRRENAVHGSDSRAAADREVGYFFPVLPVASALQLVMTSINDPVHCYCSPACVGNRKKKQMQLARERRGASVFC